VCAGDRPAGAATVSADALALLDGLLTGDWPAVDETGSGLRREASGLVAAYLQFHLERRLRSLPLVERT
jgi:DNA repair protein RecO (recombination protein O)